MSRSTLPARRLGLAAAAALALLAVAGPASAHVTVQPPTVTGGSFTQLTFRAPNERDDAATVKLEVTFPKDVPIAFLSTRPVPGWTATVEKTTLATPIKGENGDITEVASKVTWSGGRIDPGQYQNFDVSVGVLPDKATSMAFAAVQTYSSGEVVRWIEPRVEGQPDPEHPAPVLTVTAPATAEAAATPSASASAAPASAAPASAASDTSSSDSLGRWLGAGGLLAGLAALLVSVTGRRRGAEPVAATEQAKESAGV
jgi:periplasmic copper chaperone A